MESDDIRLLYIDLFCGAGGTSTGIENARVNGRKIAKVIACVNHDPHAIASHLANHHSPDTVHYTEDIRILAMEPLSNHVDAMRMKYPQAKVVLWASLECTNFSRARGGMSRDADSRTLAEHLYRYVEAIKPDLIQIENVEEIVSWCDLIIKRLPDGTPVMVKKTSGKGKAKKIWYEPAMIPDPEHAGESFWKWVRAICSYGYEFEYRILNSADYGAYTSRKRFFGMFVSSGIPMVFPMPTHARNPERNIFGEQLLPWKPVRDVLDLEDEGASIFDRKKPLVDATLRRILAGLRKFVANGKTATRTEPSGAPDRFITSYYGNGGAHSVGMPAPTVTTKDRLAMIYLDRQYGDGVPCTAENPCPSIGTNPRINPVAVHFIDNQYGHSRCSSVDSPSGTVTVNPKQALVKARMNPWLMQTNYDNVGQNIDEPCKTITADRHWTYLLNPQYSCPGNSIDEPAPTVIARQDKKPLSTVTAKTAGKLPSFIRESPEGLVYEIKPDDTAVMREIKAFMASHGIVDITMRMLRIKELKRIQGFPDDYVLIGTQEEQKKYLGNAVVTILSKVWCEALVQEIENTSESKKKAS